MLILSPRSYVTGAFDLLFPVLLEHVYCTLSPMRDWWSDYVCDYKEKIFSGSEIHKNISKDFAPNKWEDLYDYFDESSLLNLITVPLNVSRFFSKEKEQFVKLKGIRDVWVHRGTRIKKWGNNELQEREWAVESIKGIRETAILLGCVNIGSEISTLLTKMEYDWINKNVELRSHKELIEFLNKEVMDAVCNPNSPVDEKTRNRVIKSRDKLIKEAKTPEYVIDFFWNAVKSKTEIHNNIRKHDMNTFEDICPAFADYCFKKKKS